MRRIVSIIAFSMLLNAVLEAPGLAKTGTAGPVQASARPGCLPWQLVPAPTDSSQQVQGIDGVSSTDFWVVGDASTAPHAPTILHGNGTGWTIPAVEPVDGGLLGVDAISANDAWAVGYAVDYSATLAMHWDGSTWSRVSTPSPVGDLDWLGGVSGMSSTDVWAVGVTGYDQGLILHWDGSVWSIVPFPEYPEGEEFRSVKAMAPDDVWAVGGRLSGLNEYPIAQHWDGASWSEVPLPQAESGYLLMSIDGSGPDDVWTVGIGGPGSLLYRWDGTTWVKPRFTPFGLTGELRAVSDLAPNDVWVAGLKDGGGPPIAAHTDRSGWTFAPVWKTNGWVFAIKAFGDGEVWAGGYNASLGIKIARFVGCA
jgi:hypothetical protein